MNNIPSRKGPPSPDRPLSTNIYNERVVAISLGIGLAGVTSLLSGVYYDIGGLQDVGKFVLAGVGLHFLHEQLIKRLERVTVSEAISKELAPLTRNLQEVDGRLSRIERQLNASYHVIPTDPEYVKSHWPLIVEKFDSLAIIGNCPLELGLGTIEQIAGRKKTLSIYATVTRANKQSLRQLIEKQGQYPDCLRICHIERTDTPFIALGWNHGESAAEVLLNYVPPSQVSEICADDIRWNGQHLFGPAALAFYKSTFLRLVRPPAHDADWSMPIRVDGLDMLNLLADKHTAYVDELNSLTQGILFRGRTAICKGMLNALGAANRSVVITHVATNERQVKILEHELFLDWRRATQLAAQRGVGIKRIFLITREFLRHEFVVGIAEEMARHNMEVRYYPWEELAQPWRRDFSVYDGKRVMYISNHAGWAMPDEGEEEARSTHDPTMVQHYLDLFREIEQSARPFPFLHAA